MARILSVVGLVMAVGVFMALFTAAGMVEARAGDNKGKALYEKNCQSCHGADGRGNAEKAASLKIDPKVLDLGRQESANLTRDELKAIFLEGKDKMPAYKRKIKGPDQDPVLDYAQELARALRGK